MSGRGQEGRGGCGRHPTEGVAPPPVTWWSDQVTAAAVQAAGTECRAPACSTLHHPPCLCGAKPHKRGRPGEQPRRSGRVTLRRLVAPMLAATQRLPESGPGSPELRLTLRLWAQAAWLCFLPAPLFPPGCSERCFRLLAGQLCMRLIVLSSPLSPPTPTPSGKGSPGLRDQVPVRPPVRNGHVGVVLTLRCSSCELGDRAARRASQQLSICQPNAEGLHGAAPGGLAKGAFSPPRISVGLLVLKTRETDAQSDNRKGRRELIGPGQEVAEHADASRETDGPRLPAVAMAPASCPTAHVCESGARPSAHPPGPPASPVPGGQEGPSPLPPSSLLSTPCPASCWICGREGPG